MRYRSLSLLIPCALLLSACTTVTPAYKDNGPRTGSCVQGGPDSVAQQFYDYRIQHRSNDITALRPYLSDKCGGGDLPGDHPAQSVHSQTH